LIVASVQWLDVVAALPQAGSNPCFPSPCGPGQTLFARFRILSVEKFVKGTMTPELFMRLVSWLELGDTQLYHISGSILKSLFSYEVKI
jgi:hypothetical protein